VVTALSSDIQRKVALIISHSADPRFPLSAPKKYWRPTLVLLLFGFKQDQGGM